MNRVTVTIASAALAALCLTGPLAAQQGKAEIALRAAMETETVKGDLKGAIERYKKIAEQHKDTRAVAAQALLRMAGCYEKLGDPQAVRVLERIVREFPDQAEVVTVARTRLPLRNDAPNAPPSSRRLWAGAKVDVSGSVSPDGRYLSFVDWETGDLALHEFSSGLDRRLTNDASREGSQHAEDSVLSRDGKEVAYAWYNNAKFRYELRVARVDSPGSFKSRVLVDTDEITYIAPHDWSPDGKLLAARVTRADRTTQLALIGTRDGAVTALKSIDWRGPTDMAFSPDGRLVAYDIPVGDSSTQRDVFVLSVDGSRETVVAQHPGFDQVLGWSAKGDLLLFASDRSGSLALWAVPVASGIPQGTATLIRPDLGPLVAGLGVTQSGALVFAQKKGAINVYTAEIDFTTGKVLSAPKPVGENYISDNISPMWSQDGKHLAYRSVGLGKGPHLTIHSVESGTTRELKPHLAALLFPRWAPDGSFLGQGTDLKGRQGIYRVDPNSGEAMAIVAADGVGYRSHVSVSANGRTLVYRRQQPQEGTIVLRDLTTDHERELIRLSDLGFFRQSPDGRYVAYVTGDKTTKSMSLNVLSIGDGSNRELLSVREPDRIHRNLVEWTPDSTRVAFGRDLSNKPLLSVIPIAGGAAVPLDLAITNGTLRIHPAGRRVAYSAGESSYEIWTLENFVEPVGQPYGGRGK